MQKEEELVTTDSDTQAGPAGSMTTLCPRLRAALVRAAEIHEGQPRKGRAAVSGHRDFLRIISSARAGA